MARSLRTHQRRILGVVRAIASGEASGLQDILAAVTPGGGKSLLPVLAASELIRAGVVDRVCWVVPRDSLRLQAEEAFADGGWRSELGHSLSVRAAENAPDPCRGLAGYVTTYQAVAAAPELHMREFSRHRYLLVVDEIHHLPALSDAEPSGQVGEGAWALEREASWSRALLPMLELARVRLLLSGTLMRADGRPILWLPYGKGSSDRTREVDLRASGWAVVGYSRAEALREKAVLPVTFGAVQGEASWIEPDGPAVGPHTLDADYETTRPALFTALRTEFALQLLDRAFDETRMLRAGRRRKLGVMARDGGKGLGKLLVVAPDQVQARRYLDHIRGRLPVARRLVDARLAISDERDAQETLAAFRLMSEPACLVTVAMAYEGLDAPGVSVVAALTHIRSRPWLEQMIARATRIDPHAGPVDEQRALVFHPDDLLFRAFRRRIETEQGTVARRPKESRGQRLPDWLRQELGEEGRHGIVPLSSNATGLRWENLAAGPTLQVGRPAAAKDPGPLLDGLPTTPDAPTPSSVERRLRHQVGEMVAAQAVEDEAALRAPRGDGTYHRYNAVLKRVMGKGRGLMTLAELEATVGWLERNRLAEHLHLVEGDPRYAHRARRVNEAERRRLASEGQSALDATKAQAEFWRPPVGKPDTRARRG
ncbi:DEAD/DEAH box helicase [Sabulicella rubraurantiaca]|uniref:DEAD/DEAH box helicase n=1 Tax=Sabulicella rubraurantiaca TaxID=2811429 RepID=UPI001A978C6A|nr:DEAD/DEAH box helicase family protein [Sabulicella rubraurantiaca]